MSCFGAAATVSSDGAQLTIARAISLFIAAVYIITAILFLGYSIAIARRLTCGHETHIRLRRRMHAMGVLVSVCFAMSAVFWLASVFARTSVLNTSDVFTILSLLFDLLTLQCCSSSRVPSTACEIKNAKKSASAVAVASHGVVNKCTWRRCSQQFWRRGDDREFAAIALD